MSRRFKLGVLAVVVAAFAAPVPSRAAPIVPPLDHVFVVVFENQDYDTVMSPGSPATYIKRLAAENTLLTDYYGVGHVSLTNYIGMTDGELPDADTKVDCIHKYCVRDERSIADQLEDHDKTWMAYMGSMLVPCQHPPIVNAPDPFQSPYATRHNPFVYYSDIVNDPARCNAHDVPYDKTQFESMLAEDSAVPDFAFVVPDNCDNSHDPICFEPPGLPESGGLKKADDWAASHLPAIIDYVNTHDGSVLIVTFDEATTTDSRDCCDRPQDAGGGHIVTIAVGQDVRHQYVDPTGYNHYSLLRTLEDGFGLTDQYGGPEHLGVAANPEIISITAPFNP